LQNTEHILAKRLELKGLLPGRREELTGEEEGLHTKQKVKPEELQDGLQEKLNISLKTKQEMLPEELQELQEEQDLLQIGLNGLLQR